MPLTFPRAPIPLGVELNLAGVWTDISADVDQEGVVISRGRSDEAGKVEPGSLKMKLRNSAGKYSPRNPGSPLYGKIGRNTGVRCWVRWGTTRLFQGSVSQSFSTPDTAALSLAGDFDLRADLDPDTWRPTATAWVGLLKAGSYGMYIDGSGYLYCHFTTTAPATENLKSTQPLPFQVGRRAVRVTLDVDNGAAGHTATFYYADALSGTWTQLGNPVTVAGVVAIADTTNPLTTITSTELGGAQVFAVQVRNGIGGTVVASPVFEGATEGTTSITDGANTWTPLGSAAVTAKHYRFQGEIAKWPQKWGKKGSRQASVTVEAAGVTRRILQGATPTRSVLYRGCSSIGANLVSYWPFEDGVNADRVATLAPTQPARVIGTIRSGAYSDLLPSDPLTMLGSGRVYCTVANSAITAAQQVRWVTRIPASTPNGAILLRVGTNSSLGYYDVVYSTGGGLTLNCYTNNDVLSGTTGVIAFGVDDKTVRLSLELSQSGGNVSATISRLEFGQTFGHFANVVTGVATLGAPTYVYVNPNGAALGDLVFGHLTVEKAVTSLFDLASQMRAWITEDADARMSRIATENGLSLNVIGGGLSTQQMGYQKPGTVLDLLRDCEQTDGGVLYEPKFGSGLWYRTLESMCRQAPAATIAYTDNLLRPFEPVEDDQRTRNDVTLKREDAGSSRVTETAGTLGTTTIGVYDASVTMSLARDDDTWQQAGWAVHMGTVDEPRWPSIGVNLHDTYWQTRQDLVRQILSLDIGDKLAVTNLPAWLPPFPVGAIVQGYEETITPFEWTIELNCSPSSPFDTMAWSADDRWANDTTVVQSAINSTTATMPVLFYSGPRWTAADGSFDVLVGGEVMTVTGVSGAGPTQLFTVVRGVNGYQAAHSGLTPVTLYRPTYWAL